jgi:hypothetical protein
MADKRSPWTLIKQGFLPIAEQAEANIQARRVEPVIEREAPRVVDSRDLVRRQAEIAEKYRLIEEDRLRRESPAAVDPELQGYSLKQRRR